MKKLALLLLGILLGFLLCYFFFCKAAALTEEEGVPPKPKGAITSIEATKLSHGFDSRHAVIGEYIKANDNRSSWYSLDQINKFLAHAAYEAGTLNYTMDGVRIYVGAYAPGTNNGYTTMFMVPTGTPNRQEGSMLNLNLQGGGDIPGGGGLNYGGAGDPPNSNYPQ